ncbi:MAG: hypothetical protein M0025_12140 [Elusimicrobia bacterium]|nr:hypothetical protein [Elusimicrobiota bacterium]
MPGSPILLAKRRSCSGDKVTCLSCHASELTAGLQMPGGQTALCLACHRL